MDIFCFQPTYEELKQYSHEIGEGNHQRFQPTYEELKQGKIYSKCNSTMFSAYLRGIETIWEYPIFPSCSSFQPTYEELKL